MFCSVAIPLPVGSCVLPAQTANVQPARSFRDQRRRLPRPIPDSGQDLVSGNRIERNFLLPAGACAVIHEG